ncbi:hypothetical protein FRB99_003257 [Tulasnella sp. 403]|nr:hypothetical protein FRB99_003257 [Tulasnella sp. 403]
MGSAASTGRVKSVTMELNGGRTKKIKVNPGPIVTGNFCDLFQGSEASLGTVALKRWRVTTNGATPEQQEASACILLPYAPMIDSEVATWKQLTHPNILPFLGTGSDKQNLLYLISPWMDNGSLHDYIVKKPRCDRIRFLRETAEALVFVHDMGIIHGDLKAQNILVSQTEHALLCDFNLSKQELTLTIAGLKGTGSLPFQSPELWEGASRTRATDVYAFGMTIYQVLSGKVPFEQYKTHAALLGAILKRGEVPPKTPDASPSGMSYERYWGIAERCWNREADERPTMSTILDSLQ